MERIHTIFRFLRHNSIITAMIDRNTLNARTLYGMKIHEGIHPVLLS